MCHTFLRFACNSRMSVCFLTRAKCKNVRQNLIPRATAYSTLLDSNPCCPCLAKKQDKLLCQQGRQQCGCGSNLITLFVLVAQARHSWAIQVSNMIRACREQQAEWPASEDSCRGGGSSASHSYLLSCSSARVWF